jgi:hypothetical protein
MAHMKHACASGVAAIPTRLRSKPHRVYLEHRQNSGAECPQHEFMLMGFVDNNVYACENGLEGGEQLRGKFIRPSRRLNLAVPSFFRESCGLCQFKIAVDLNVSVGPPSTKGGAAGNVFLVGAAEAMMMMAAPIQPLRPIESLLPQPNPRPANI